jgi:putative NIF3 family GTP cyclohydrolase 1 type 2
MKINCLSSSGNRRKFLQQASALAGGGLLLSSPLSSFAALKSYTVGEIMDLFIGRVPNAPFPQTVDTLKAGSRDYEVSGIVTTMFATIPVIKQAISLGANFIIAHEPTFYSHTDATDWLQNDDVFRYKMKLLNDNKISVWRNHDYIHSHRPDGVFEGVLEQLGWKKFVKEGSPWNIELPQTTLAQLIATVKNKLKINTLRYIGDDNLACRKILLLPGASGGRSHIESVKQNNPDVLLVGELQEWETAEYIRDARESGKKIGLIVLGHTDSEDGGSIYMKQWLDKNVQGIKATHIHSGNPFSFK